MGMLTGLTKSTEHPPRSSSNVLSFSEMSQAYCTDIDIDIDLDIDIDIDLDTDINLYIHVNIDIDMDIDMDIDTVAPEHMLAQSAAETGRKLSCRQRQPGCFQRRLGPHCALLLESMARVAGAALVFLVKKPCQSDPPSPRNIQKDLQPKQHIKSAATLLQGLFSSAQFLELRSSGNVY